MAIPWESIRTLVLFFGPILLPKAIGYYRSVRSASRLHGLSIQPVPPRVQTALGVLAILCLGYLVKSLPFLGPENLFSQTESRLQIPVDVLFNRVAAIRPGNVLTPTDDALRAKFVNLESRLLYLQFGPDVVADCPFCNADEPRSYFYYALPALVWPHIANLAIIAAVTSSTWTGRHGAKLRTTATITAVIIGSLDVYIVSSYNYQLNSRALRLYDMEMFFWSIRAYRLVVLAALNALLAWALYLSSTNRAFVSLPSPSERIDTAYRVLQAVKTKMNALGIVRNTTMRDQDLRSRSNAYWSHEVQLMGEIMEDREVVEGVKDALSNRISIQDITRDADIYAQSVLKPLQDSSEG